MKLRPSLGRSSMPGERSRSDVNAPPSPVQSPCISVCRIDPASGLCAGCLRTLDEIAAWGALDDAARRGILEAVAARRTGRNGSP